MNCPYCNSKTFCRDVLKTNEKTFRRIKCYRCNSFFWTCEVPTEVTEDLRTAFKYKQMKSNFNKRG